MSDSVNSNLYIRDYLQEGFQEAYPDLNIICCSIDLITLSDTSLDYLFVIAVGGVLNDSSNLLSLRKFSDKLGVPLFFWLHDDPYELDFAFKAELLADIIFTNDLWSLEHYEHPDVFHLPLAASERVHYRKIDIENKKLSGFFAGVAYPNRLDFFRKLESSNLTDGVEVLGDWWPEGMNFCINRRIGATEFSDYCSKSWFTFNIGRDFNLSNKFYDLPSTTPGPRIFEAALSGTVQLSFVDSLEVSNYFNIDGPDIEILLIDSISDVKNFFSLIHDDPYFLMRIALSSQKRALRDHTYKSRALEIFARFSSFSFS